MVKAKRILIESETTERFSLRVTGPRSAQMYCPNCERVDEMLDLNSAADISGTRAREILALVEAGELHSPETSTGHLLICRGSLEQAINADKQLRPPMMLLKEGL